MKNKNLLKVIVLFLIILFFCLLCFLLYLMKTVPETVRAPIIVDNTQKQEENERTVENKVEENSYLDEVSIADTVEIYTPNEYLKYLSAMNMNIGALENYLGESEELENGYKSYGDREIFIKATLENTVRNIIFTEKYDEDIIKKVNTKTSLKEILELYPKNTFGSLNQGYLGYLTKDFYYFFYDDEVSVYGYTYKVNENFERILSRYLEDNDLDKFVNSIKASVRYYDYLEYDPEIKKAHIMFSNRGIEIDIEENNPKGIILYNNYFLTDVTKKFVESDQITLNAEEDSVEKFEKQRRSNR